MLSGTFFDKMTVAIIRFPGSNCEEEAKQALDAAGIASEWFDWNQSLHTFDAYSGYVLPGGFSFQDRVRAGVIASKLPVIQALKKESKQRNKLILGICNGAQILAESGLIQLTQSDDMDCVIDQNYVNDSQIGFMCDWAFLKPFGLSSSPFLTVFNESDVLPVQVCHGEGRFVVSKQPNSGFRYCDIFGNVSDGYPIVPNGAQYGLAAVSNAVGNVFAMMPHPERSFLDSRWPPSICRKIELEGVQVASWIQLFHAFKAIH